MKILYKAEATNPEAELRENITLDIKDGAALKKTKTALPDITLHDITLLETSYPPTPHRFTLLCVTLHRSALQRPTSHCPTS